LQYLRYIGEINALVLSAFNLEKTVYIATVGALSFVIDSTRIAAYITGGIGLEPAIIPGFLIYIPTYFVGAMIWENNWKKTPRKIQKFYGAFYIFIWPEAGAVSIARSLLCSMVFVYSSWPLCFWVGLIVDR
jgi:hypothetical protein